MLRAIGQQSTQPQQFITDVTFFACATTMGVMGVAEGDLISGCEIAGAAAFLDFAAEADVQLFI